MAFEMYAQILTIAGTAALFYGTASLFAAFRETRFAGRRSAAPAAKIIRVFIMIALLAVATTVLAPVAVADSLGPAVAQSFLGAAALCFGIAAAAASAALRDRLLRPSVHAGPAIALEGPATAPAARNPYLRHHPEPVANLMSLMHQHLPEPASLAPPTRAGR